MEHLNVKAMLSRKEERSYICYNRKIVLVTGASGFIGAEVCKKIVSSKKYNVVAVVSPFSKSIRLKDLKDKLIIKKANLEDTKSVDNLFKKFKPDVVLHLSTHGVYQYQQSDFERIVIGNYFMSLNLLESSKKYGIKKFINTGSVFEYGTKIGRVKENDIRLNDIINKYSAIKMATTALANSYTEDLKIITLRPFTAYGNSEDSTRFMRATINRALKNEDLRIVKDVFRDFIYVEDIAEAYLSALTENFESGLIVNIGSGKKISLEKVCRLIIKITKSKSKIVHDNNYVRGKESACYADITQAKKVLKWKPRHTLLMGLKKMIYSLSRDY